MKQFTLSNSKFLTVLGFFGAFVGLACLLLVFMQ